MHFYESSIITSKDGIHFQVYGNEHPVHTLLVKPKYIPTDKIESKILQSRFISGRKMNRLNLWENKEEVKRYIAEFKSKYPQYIFKSEIHNSERLFFGLPIDEIERVYSPKRGLSELMSFNQDNLDPHLRLVYDFVKFILESGLKIDDLGITYSSLVGHYYSSVSDINIVVHGKNNFIKLMNFLEKSSHELLKWKTKEQWIQFYKRRNRRNIFDENDFIKAMSRKRSEGYFGDSLFVIFCVENENERWFKWGEETYQEKGFVKVRARVKNNYNSIVRPGYYEIEDSQVIEGYENVVVKRIVFYSRDYAMIAFNGELIEAQGILEKVSPKNGEPYYRVVLGYFDSYLNDRIEKEYIKPIFESDNINKFSGDTCEFCNEKSIDIGSESSYGSIVICKVGDAQNGWFASLSPKTAGNIHEDFSIQLIPNKHLKYFSEINNFEESAKNYGILFGKINHAVFEMLKEQGFSDKSPVCIYGKCKHSDEHIHIKIFPYRNETGQPFVVDSSFEKKKIYFDEEGEFVKMSPVKKKKIDEHRLHELAEKFIEVL